MPHDKKSPLENIRVAAPCDNAWADMKGDLTTRTCGECRLPVYDLSTLTEEDSLALLVKKEGRCPSQLFRRQDGTYMAKNCPHANQFGGANVGASWKLLAQQLGGQFEERREGGFKLYVAHNAWTITMDTYATTLDAVPGKYTRIRAPFYNADKFRFNVYPRGIFSGVGKLFGVEDIVVGVPGFDHDFIIQGSDESKLQQLFSNYEIRRLLTKARVRIEVRGTSYPGFDIDELYFQELGEIVDLPRLADLFEIFRLVLDQLAAIKSANTKE